MTKLVRAADTEHFGVWSLDVGGQTDPVGEFGSGGSRFGLSETDGTRSLQLLGLGCKVWCSELVLVKLAYQRKTVYGRRMTRCCTRGTSMYYVCPLVSRPCQPKRCLAGNARLADPERWCEECSE